MALCEAVVAECRERQTALLCKCASRFQLSNKANGHMFLNWNNGTSHYFIDTFLFLITYLVSPSSQYSCIYVYFFFIVEK